MFRAREQASGREVALKLLTFADERLQERFRREGELTASLRHRGIVGVYAGGVFPEGTPYLAYELIGEGRTLRDLLREHDPADPAARGRLLDVLEQVAEALGHAHARGVVHRDLKPGNVLIDAAGAPRVADFGLARAEGAASLTQSGAVVGTPSHMAPEQLLGERERVGPASDVWALGVILYRVLTGQPPFPAQTMAELSQKVLRGEPTPPRALTPGVAPALEALCLRALAREPEERFAEGGALAEALRAARAGERARARPGRARLAALGGGRLAALGGGVLLVLLGGLTLSLWPRGAGELGAALLAYERGELGAGELAALVSGRAAGGEPRLLAEAHLRLAQRADAPLAARLAHARRGRALEVERSSGEAALLEGELLAELGEHPAALAALAWGRARVTPQPEQALLEAALLLRLGRPSEAEAACARAPGALDPGARRAALTLRGRAALQLGELEQAAARAAALAELSPPAAAELRAELQIARGEDPRAALAAAARAHPHYAPLGLRRARGLLALGEARSARAALADSREGPQGVERFAREDPPLDRARELLEGLCADPPRLAGWPGAPPAWQAAAAAWWAALARRELALRRRAASLVHWTPAEAPAADERAARARAAAQAALALSAAPAAARARAHLVLHELGVADQLALAAACDPRDGEVAAARARAALTRREPAAALAALAEAEDLGPAGLSARGQALLALGRGAEAAAPLEAAFLAADRLDARVAGLLARALAEEQPERAAELREWVALLGGSRAAEARQWRQRAAELQRDRASSRREVFAALEQAALLDPLDHLSRAECLRYLARGGADEERLTDLLRTTGFDLRLLSTTWRDLLQISGGLGEAPYVAQIAERLAGEDRWTRWARCLLRAFALTHEERADWLAPTLREATRLLGEEPADLFLAVVRAGLLVRAGRLAEAEGELSWLRRELPRDPLLTFQELLLAARRRAPAPRLAALLRLLEQQGFELPSARSWTLADFPELAPYEEGPGFERLRGALDRR